MLNQVQYINLSEIVHVLKAVPIVTRVHLNISMIFVVSLLLSAKVTPEWRLNPSFGTNKKCPSLLNRGVIFIAAAVRSDVSSVLFSFELFCIQC